jgi:hypothetical protein
MGAGRALYLVSSMGSDGIDVLACGESAASGRWIAFLRSCGVTVMEVTPTVLQHMDQLPGVRGVIGIVSGPSSELIASTVASGCLPSALILLDGPLGMTLPRLPVVNAYSMTVEQARLELLRVLDDLHAAPDAEPWQQCGPSRENHRRGVTQPSDTGAVTWRRPVMAAAIAASLLSLGFWAWKPVNSSKGSVGGRISAAVPSPTSANATPLQRGSGRPVPPEAMPPASPANVADPKDRALAHVKYAISIANRDNGLTSAQIEAMVGCHADPAHVSEKGLQFHKGLEATFLLKSQEWPYWRESITTTEIITSDNPAFVDIIVKSTFELEYYPPDSRVRVKNTGFRVTAYTVDCRSDRPLITKIDSKVFEYDVPAAIPFVDGVQPQ